VFAPRLLLLLALWPAAVPAAAADPDPAAGAADRAGAYYHLMRATIAAQRGAVRELTRELREAIRLDPGSPELRVEGAELMLSLGQLVEAEKMARAALRLDPAYPRAARILAGMETRKALRDDDPASRAEAIRLWEVVAADPQVDADALQTLAQLKFRDGDIEGAVEIGRRLALKRRGDVRVAHMNARLYQAAGRPSEALDVLLEFLREHGEEEILLGEVRELADATGRWDAVERACDARIEKGQSTPLLRRLRGEARHATGRFQGAVEDLEAAVQGGVEDPRALLYLADAYGALGRLADAVASTRALADLLPDNPNVRAMLGDYLARQREWGPALEALESALAGLAEDEASAERRDAVRRRLVLLYLEQGEPERARAVIETLEEPDRPESLELAGRVALSAGDAASARTLAGRLQRAGQRGPAALIEGELLVIEDKPARASEKFERVISELGAGAALRVAEIWRAHEQAQRGEQVLRTWARRQAKDADAHFGLGSFLERLGRYQEAEASLRRAIELDPEHANALNYLGYSLADRGVRLDEALELIRRALGIEPWNGAYLDSLGWVLYRLERYEDAREPLERAVRELPGDPTVLDHLGDLYRELGEHELAVSSWRRALLAGADDAESVRRKIATEEARLDERESDTRR